MGTTLFWAVGGWHRGESVRVARNFTFARANLCHYWRGLGQVGWPGEEIDPFWSDFKPTLAATIDCAYDEGLLTQLTGIGGWPKDAKPKPGRGPVECAREMADVLATRQHKILIAEAVNESNASEADAIEIARLFGSLGIPSGVGLGNQGIDVIERASRAADARVAYYHTSRTLGDQSEAGGRESRFVRQCWDFKEFDWRPDVIRVDNEGPGIASSVNVLSNPFTMATKRAANLVLGAAVTCVHTGAGVFGRLMAGPYGLRQANLFEVPGLVEMFAAVANADMHLPPGIENWTPFNTNQPVKVITGRVNKLYGSRSGKQFAEIAIGCDGPTMTLQAKKACDLGVVNPATGEVLFSRAFAKDETAVVPSLWAYLLIGTER